MENNKMKYPPYEEAIIAPREEINKWLKEDLAGMSAAYTVEEMTGIISRAYDRIYDEKPTLTNREIYSRNHMTIRMCISTYLRETGRMPAVSEISAYTKLSRVTISKHLRKMHEQDYFKMYARKWELLAESVLESLYRDIRAPGAKFRDSHRASDLFLKHVEKFTSIGGAKADQEPKAPNLIQINNIYITAEAIKALPEDKREQIETIFLESVRNKPINPPEEQPI